MNTPKVQSAPCPECNTWISLKTPARLKDLVSCPTCGAWLEVVFLKPPVLERIAAASRPTQPTDHMSKS